MYEVIIAGLTYLGIVMLTRWGYALPGLASPTESALDVLTKLSEPTEEEKMREKVRLLAAKQGVTPPGGAS